MASGAIVERRRLEMHSLKEPYYAYGHCYIRGRLLGHVYGLFTPAFRGVVRRFQKEKKFSKSENIIVPWK